LVVTPGSARANDRHFAWTYESASLPQGHAEIEPQVTARYGRSNWFGSLEYRLEFEVGLTDRLLAAVYLNGATMSMDTPIQPVGTLRTSFAGLTGASGEVKYRLLDAVADPIGLALYGEITGGTNPYEQGTDATSPDFLEIESKVILDRRLGNFLFAANLIYAHEFVFHRSGTTHDNELELSAGVGYFVTPALMLGVELREHNVITPDSGWESSALMFGPTIAYSAQRFWVALNVMPQIAAFVGAEPGDFRSFHDHEAFNARLLLGLHL
jgi:hypothetical protein